MSNLHNLATRTTDCSIISSTSAFASADTATLHALKGKISRSGMSTAITAGTAYTFTITDNRVGPDSVVVCNFVSGATTAPAAAYFNLLRVTVSSGSFIVVYTPTANITVESFSFEFYVLNPVCSK